jgi:drug/metabolite transporter (DMT)-like permease
MMNNKTQLHVAGNERSKARVILLFSGFFWGLSFPLLKSVLVLNEKLVPRGGGLFTTLYVVAPRFAIASALLLAFQARAGLKMTRGELKQGFTVGLFAAAAILLQNDGLRFTSASTSAFLTTFYAVMIPIWLALRRRRSPGATVWASCLLVLAGTAVLGHLDWRTLRLGRGEWETLLCSLFFMGQILALGDEAFARNRPLPMTLVACAVIAAIFGALAWVAAPSPQALLLPWTSPAWVGLTVILGVFCSLAAFLLIAIWQPKVTATEAGLIYCFEPVFAALLALFLPALISRWAGIDYPNEHATPGLLLGGGLITLANVLVQVRQPT